MFLLKVSHDLVPFYLCSLEPSLPLFSGRIQNRKYKILVPGLIAPAWSFKSAIEPFSSPEPVVSWSLVGYKLSRVALGTRMTLSLNA